MPRTAKRKLSVKYCYEHHFRAKLSGLHPVNHSSTKLLMMEAAENLTFLRRWLTVANGELESEEIEVSTQIGKFRLDDLGWVVSSRLIIFTAYMVIWSCLSLQKI